MIYPTVDYRGINVPPNVQAGAYFFDIGVQIPGYPMDTHHTAIIHFYMLVVELHPDKGGGPWNGQRPQDITIFNEDTQEDEVFTYCRRMGSVDGNGWRSTMKLDETHYQVTQIRGDSQWTRDEHRAADRFFHDEGKNHYIVNREIVIIT